MAAEPAAGAAAGEVAAGVTREAEVAGEAQLAVAVAPAAEAAEGPAEAAEGPAVEQASAAELEAAYRPVPCITVHTISRDS
jgi:hypothetical protein